MLRIDFNQIGIHTVALQSRLYSPFSYRDDFSVAPGFQKITTSDRLNPRKWQSRSHRDGKQNRHRRSSTAFDSKCGQTLRRRHSAMTSTARQIYCLRLVENELPKWNSPFALKVKRRTLSQFRVCIKLLRLFKQLAFFSHSKSELGIETTHTHTLCSKRIS